MHAEKWVTASRLCNMLVWLIDIMDWFDWIFRNQLSYSSFAVAENGHFIRRDDA